MKRTEIVQRIKQALQRVVPTAKVILYGSEARGDARADSDIDLLILLQDKERITLNDRMKLTEPLYDIELETGIQINPYIELMKEWGRRVTPFYDNVTKEGIVLL
mgnify:FL=1